MLIPFSTVCVYLTRHWRSSLFSPTEFQKDDSRSSELSIRNQKIIGRQIFHRQVLGQPRSVIFRFVVFLRFHSNHGIIKTEAHLSTSTQAEMLLKVRHSTRARRVRRHMRCGFAELCVPESRWRSIAPTKPIEESRLQNEVQSVNSSLQSFQSLLQEQKSH